MSDIATWVDKIVEQATERCTVCGKCAAACPTAQESGLDLSAPETLVRGLIALSRDGVSDGDGARWVSACDQSGQCSAACPEGINVRQWVAAAGQRLSHATRDETERKGEAARRFRAMSHAVRLLASMQMPSEALERITRPVERRKAELLFYTGCNVLKTSHIVFNVMDILEALDIDFDVVGGPSHCCGVYQFNAGDQGTYENVGARTFRRFGQSGAEKILTWCPTCTKNFDEIEADRAPPSFELGHISSFLAGNLDRLRPHFRDQKPRRAVIHEHQGIKGTRESVRALMEAVPNLTVVELPQDSGFSYACGGAASRYVEREQAIHRNMAEGAVAVGRRPPHHDLSFLPSRARRRGGTLSVPGRELHRCRRRGAWPRLASRLLQDVQIGRRDGGGGRRGAPPSREQRRQGQRGDARRPHRRALRRDRPRRGAGGVRPSFCRGDAANLESGRRSE